jgi:citrate synthase
MQQKPVFHGNLTVADQAITRTIAYFTTAVALVHCHKSGKEFTPAEPGRSLIGNLLHMMGISDPKIEACLDKLWILYADHEMSNSTAALLHAGSTLTDPLSALISALISAIVSGYGPLHGGAIHLAYDEFRQIGTPENPPLFIEECKNNKAQLFGYGHRVYLDERPSGFADPGAHGRVSRRNRRQSGSPGGHGH